MVLVGSLPSLASSVLKSLAVATLRSFWHRFVKDGVDVKWVQRARDAFVTNRLLRYETSGALASELVWRWNQGWPLSSIDAPFSSWR